MTGLRERKKQATRQALREAALRLALDRGPENVRVEEIAEAAGVSPRTYNNYFASREQAIVAAVTAERESRIAAAVARACGVPLADAVFDAVVAEHTSPGDRGREVLLLITTNPGLRGAFVESAASLEGSLAEVIAERIGDAATAEVLAAGVAAAVRVGLRRWLSGSTGGLVVPSGSLPEVLRSALAPLAPAFAAVS